MTTLQRPQKEMNTNFLSLLHSGTIDPNSFHIFKSYTEFGFEYLSIPMIEWQASQKKGKCKENLNLYGCTIQLLFESYLKLKKIAKIFKKQIWLNCRALIIQILICHLFLLLLLPNIRWMSIVKLRAVDRSTIQFLSILGVLY